MFDSKRLILATVMVASALASAGTAAKAETFLVEPECVTWGVHGPVEGKTPKRFDLGRKALFPELPAGPDGGDVSVTVTRSRRGKPLNRGKMDVRVDAFERPEDALKYQLDGGGGGPVGSGATGVKFNQDTARFGDRLKGTLRVYIVDLMLKRQPRLKIGESIVAEACVTPVNEESCDSTLAEPACTYSQLTKIAEVRRATCKLPSISEIDERCWFWIEPDFLIDVVSGDRNYIVSGACSDGNVVESGSNYPSAINFTSAGGRHWMESQDADCRAIQEDALLLQEALIRNLEDRLGNN